MCLFSKRLNEAIVRAKLSKLRGEQRHDGGEDDGVKGVARGAGRGRGREGGGRGRGENAVEAADRCS